MRINDDYIVEYLAKHPTGEDPYSDAWHHPYEFLQGYRDAEQKITLDYPHHSMAQGYAYRLGRSEYEYSQ